MKTLPTLLALGVGMFLWGFSGVVALQAADEPKRAPKSALDLNKEIEATKERIEALNKAFEQLKRKTEEDTKRKLMPPADALRSPTPPQVEASTGKTEAQRGKIVAINEEWGFVVIDSDQKINAIEATVREFVTARTGVEMAERRSAEKIEALVREADANAKLLLRGGAPSSVLGR